MGQNSLFELSQSLGTLSGQLLGNGGYAKVGQVGGRDTAIFQSVLLWDGWVFHVFGDLYFMILNKYFILKFLLIK